MLLFILCFIANSFAEKPSSVHTEDYQVINIYVDLSVVIAPDGKKGTSNQLNTLVSHYAQLDSLLSDKLHKFSSPYNWDGEINVYDWTNIQYMPGFNHCNYADALACGVKNNHWTLRTTVSVGDKYAVFTQKLYDGHGKIIAQSSKTAWGKIRWKPQWKLTQIKEQGAFGGSSTEIFEQWPAVMEELPPLIKPLHVAQSRYGVYEIERRACTTKTCDKLYLRK